MTRISLKIRSRIKRDKASKRLSESQRWVLTRIKKPMRPKSVS